jgi:hypothetical protein
MMADVRYPVTMFMTTVLVVIGLGVGVLALSGAGLRPVPTLETPASVLALAKLGTEGTFSAVYKLSGGPPGTTNGEAVLTIAQRAPEGTSPSLSPGRGEWTYRLKTSDGLIVEWLMQGSTLEDCMSFRSSRSLQCTGPAPFGEAYGGNGYMIATVPFLPETAFDSIDYAFGSMPPHHRLSVRTLQSGFGLLTCVTVNSGQDTWCLKRDGHLATFSGVGYVAFLWSKYQLVSEQATAPATDFTLSGVPKEPFILPMP